MKTSVKNKPRNGTHAFQGLERHWPARSLCYPSSSAAHKYPTRRRKEEVVRSPGGSAADGSPDPLTGELPAGIPSLRLLEGQRDLAEVVFKCRSRKSQFSADPEHFSIIRQHDSVKLIETSFLCNTDQHIDQFIPDPFPLILIMDDHPKFSAL